MTNTSSFIEREKAANNRAYANTKARTAARKALQAAYNTLVENGAYEDAMNGLDWAEKPATRTPSPRSLTSSA